MRHKLDRLGLKIVDNKDTDQREQDKRTISSIRSYTAPRIISAEKLELSGGVKCDPPTGGFGKLIPGPCINAGS